jgi:hypothetical protein
MNRRLFPRFSARQLWFDTEDRVSDLLANGHFYYATFAGRRWLRSKNQLRGRACHCPSDMPLHLVHSEGLREGADVVIDFGSNVRCPGRMQIPVGELKKIASEIGEGDIVHVKSDLFPEFVQHLLPNIASPIILVTGDSDYGPVKRFVHLLDDPKILHWFAQNCDVPFRHAKLTRIPIGIDNPFYTKLEKRIGFLIEMLLGKTSFDPKLNLNDMGDQRLMQQISAKISSDVSSKPLRALCTFHKNQKLAPNFDKISERLQAYELLKDNPDCYFVRRRLHQTEYWMMHADFAFEISPRGKGLDCFRTWECLMLNTIPIVKSSTLDPLFIDEDFPVAVVESYQEITRENLLRWRDCLSPKFTPQMVERLTNEYWLNRIRDFQSSAVGLSGTANA